jgi:hypothetical protein
VDFEERVVVVMRALFPSTDIKCCRFHLAQAWWQKIQSLGLSKEYKQHLNVPFIKISYTAQRHFRFSVHVNITIPFSASFTCKNVSDLFVTTG